MNLWIVSPDPSVPIASADKLSEDQMQRARTGDLFLARASSPVFAKSLAEGLRSLSSRLHGMGDVELEKQSLWRRPVKMTRSGEAVPVYEARFYWPS